VCVCVCSGKSALGALEAAAAEAAKHASRSEPLAALVAAATVVLEKGRAEAAERARVAAAAAAAAAAAKAAAAAEAAAERQQMEQEMAAMTLRMQEMQQKLGSTRPLSFTEAAPTPQSDAEEATLCVVCADAPKDHIMIPCMHMCACKECAKQLLEQDPPRCPVCRGDIQQTARVQLADERASCSFHQLIPLVRVSVPSLNSTQLATMTGLERQWGVG
jgi:hypothetical protein